MQINCLRTQEKLFETRLLRRALDPVFVDAEDLTKRLDGPLMLYGQWHPQGFWAGLRWLAGQAYFLPHPCILLPPFESGSLSDVLGLAIQLNVQSVNSNYLSTLPEAEPLKFAEKQILQIQSDFAFSGPAGKPWLVAGEPPLATVILIQPKNTSTPLLLCGARLLSVSGLSHDEDRLSLLERIVSWGWNWQQTPDHAEKKSSTPAQLDDAIWHVICIVLAGSGLTAPKEIVALSRTLFGIEISEVDLQLGMSRLIELGLAVRDDENLKVNLDALESYTQQMGLWAYVRSLRKDFERTKL